MKEKNYYGYIIMKCRENIIFKKIYIVLVGVYEL